jgi:hypothetical protein
MSAIFTIIRSIPLHELDPSNNNVPSNELLKEKEKKKKKNLKKNLINLPIAIHPQTNIVYPGALRWSRQQDPCTRIHQHRQLLPHLNLLLSQFCMNEQLKFFNMKHEPFIMQNIEHMIPNMTAYSRPRM